VRDEDVVLEGAAANLIWRVLVTGHEQDLLTMLHVHRDGRPVDISGFGGPALYPGALVNEWRGRADGLPYFVMARAHPSVERLVAETEKGLMLDLDLSPVVPRYRLRFAAAALPPGEAPGRLHLSIQDGTQMHVLTPVSTR